MAAAEGAAKLIKNGLAFTVMTGVIAGLLWAIAFLNETHVSQLKEFKGDVREMKEDYSAQLNELRREVSMLRDDLQECNAQRIQDAKRIAQLEAMLNRNR